MLKMPAVMVNESVNRTLYNSIKYNTGLTVEAHNIFIQTTGSLLTKGWVKWLNATKTISGAFVSLMKTI